MNGKPPLNDVIAFQLRKEYSETYRGGGLGNHRLNGNQNLMTSNFLWGGCSDDMEFGVEFSKRFDKHYPLIKHFVEKINKKERKKIEKRASRKKFLEVRSSRRKVLAKKSLEKSRMKRLQREDRNVRRFSKRRRSGHKAERNRAGYKNTKKTKTERRKKNRRMWKTGKRRAGRMKNDRGWKALLMRQLLMLQHNRQVGRDVSC